MSTIARNRLLSRDLKPFHALATDRTGVVQVWRERYRFRQHLRRLLKVGPYVIRDVGLEFEPARREAGKPFWRE